MMLVVTTAKEALKGIGEGRTSALSGSLGGESSAADDGGRATRTRQRGAIGEDSGVRGNLGCWLSCWSCCS